MKIKVKKMPYAKVAALPKEKPITPKRTSALFRWLMKTAAKSDLKDTNFTWNDEGLKQLGDKEPCLFLMNHSSFIDLNIAATILYPRRFNIVMTSDGFVGKRWFMRGLGCIPTNKFVTDTALVRNMMKCLKELKTSVLLYPEASYSFDGTATALPNGMGKCVKILGAPVVMIRTYGAFSRDPLYNNLQKRKVKVSATTEYILSPEQIKKMSVEEINTVLKERFTFDNFRWQQENNVVIDEPFRADGLERVLYKCPHCLAEGHTVGKGVTLTCNNCGKSYVLDESGYLRANGFEGAFDHIPNWYAWERQSVKEDVVSGSYKLDIDVNVLIMKGYKAVYDIGSGRLTHDKSGFRLVAADGQLDYFQPSSLSYSVYSDYFWYEIGDVICIGNNDCLYYCFPKGVNGVVAKTRLATEEIYKLIKS
ncbi:MAG: 1-acyl-sn-glycerol-3-phosphate acyltransferase [Corallococcus sp.]|nr:1-acyl-sn-glycerol-3-phosphate acyltransferase [Bacillota bacterium]MCM1533943.1 1-acyl-sn-glycerol-3-phosphate acyltransferase [Corallococcus sp.]